MNQSRVLNTSVIIGKKMFCHHDIIFIYDKGILHNFLNYNSDGIGSIDSNFINLNPDELKILFDNSTIIKKKKDLDSTYKWKCTYDGYQLINDSGNILMDENPYPTFWGEKENAKIIADAVNEYFERRR